MKPIFQCSLMGTAFLSLALLVSAADLNFTLPVETAQLKTAPGSELAMGNCILCHSADYISTQPRFPRSVWQAEVVKMQQKYRAPIATNDIPALVDYFVQNYGRENPPAASPK